MARILTSFLVAVVAVLGLGTGSAQDSSATNSYNLPLKTTRNIEFDVDEGTWISLDVSPDGKTIVFDLLGDLYAIDIAGGKAHLISGGLAFDSQPAYSPDGSEIAFITDRSGNENLWIAGADGTRPIQISNLEDNTVFISPAWAADGKSIFVSRFKPDLNAFEIWQYDLTGRGENQITHAKSSPDQAKEFRSNALGAVASPDGRYLYCEEKTGLGFADEISLPLWHIVRRNLSTGEVETIVTAQGSAMRPAISPDGRLLLYGTRWNGETELRLRDLNTGSDRALLYPIQHDEQEASASRDLLPRYAFTPDGKSLVISYGGKIRRVDIATSATQVIPFTAHVALGVGPNLRLPLKEETGPVRARLIQWPTQSPDGRRLLLSALGHIYVMDLSGGLPRRLTTAEEPEFQPSWSPDGKSIVYVTWTAARGGQIWRVPATGDAHPTQLTTDSAFYTNPVFTLDGSEIIAVRSSNYERMHRHLEYGSVREADAIRLPAKGGSPVVFISGVLGGTPQFTQESGRVVLNFQDGLYSVDLNGHGRWHIVEVKGPGFYFQEGTFPADDLKISPDGKWVLAQIIQQLHLVAVPPEGTKSRVVELGEPSPPHAKLTTVGADFFAWADGGKTITWALGSSFYRRPLDRVSMNQPPKLGGPKNLDGTEAFEAVVEVPRDVPKGAIVLRGATAITMKGDEVIENADIVIVDNRIAAVGKQGKVELPHGAELHDVSGKFIIPGFVDVHLHRGEVRRGVLDLENWGFLASLAYGVTTGLDPSPLSIDMLAYEDLIDAGFMTGPRVYSTGPAVFSFNSFSSKEEVSDVLGRYPDHYRTRNLKEYRTGNRRQREWVAQAAHDLGIMPTTEGALDMKLDLTQVQDGFAGSEHALTAVPIFDDIVQLYARTRDSYTPTLEISNGGPPAQNYFLTNASPHDDAKLNRFIPHFVIAEKTERLKWYWTKEYLYPRIAQGAARIMRAGGPIGVGSHGEVQGLAYHWELQALAAGGLSPHEVLRAATIESSEVIGRNTELGSLEPGKFADLLVLDKNPLEDVQNARPIREVMKNGRLYNADTLDEVWPRERHLQPLWFWEEAPPHAGADPY